MNRDQSYTLIRQTFTQGFDKARFQNFAVNLLNRIDESKAQVWNSTYVKDAFKDHVNRYERLGTYTTPDNDILDVLIVHLTSETKLARARTAIRNFVAHHLKTRDEKDAALVAFVSPTEKQWRLSYVKMEYATVEKESGKVGVETRLTPARRFSYIVGEGESCHTAQTRFLPLLQDTTTDPKLTNIEEAFSVEAVTKEFFKRYVDLFESIHQALEKLIKKDKAIRDEFEAKNVNTVDFAKKLLGQIVFLYFLQKKGWLGVEKGKDWGTGPHDFLRRMARGEYGEYQNYFNDALEPLFYDTLATDRGHEAWCRHFKCRIPFLNGGLFEALGGYDWRKSDILLPNRLFTNHDPVEEGIIGTGILDVFDRYNFTVNEAEPLEKEVAIDPEMLGKVFENLIEENRRKGLGSYYTPREIVHYMCEESLINYLDTVLNKEKVLVPRQDIETFIHTGDQAAHYEAARISGSKSYKPELPKPIETHARLIDDKLQDITVCDPAVGSGAFPVGMMTEIVRARSALTPYFNDIHERTPYFFKRHAIQKCLYGVDIDPGAVEIAKLRLWLSLVVDEEDVKQIKPLPNLDYKIATGNSLLGVEKNLFNNELFIQLEKLKPQYFDETDSRKKAALKQKIDDLIHQLTQGKESFDFEIYFSEVFQRSLDNSDENCGFNIVIQNPPYVQIKAIPPTERRIYEKLYKFTTGRFNLFYLFIERCELLLKRNGIASFIVPDRLLLNTQCKNIRSWLLNDNNIVELVSFADQVFETVVVDSILLQFQRAPRASDFVRSRRKVAQESVNEAQVIMIPLSYFELSASSQFDLNYTPAKLALYTKIRANSVELSTISETKDGIIQGKVEDHLFLSARKDSDSKPLLFGEDIGRYSIAYNHNWVNYKPDEMMALEIKRRGKGVRPGLWMRDHRIFERPKILTRQTADEIIAAYDVDNYYYSNTLHGTTVTDKAYDARYLLGILNSQVTTWYYRSNTDEEGKVFAQIKIELLRKLPIPKADNLKQQLVIRLVDKICIKKQRDPAADTSLLEDEIDKLVYKLYSLTEDEIAIVERKAC